MPLTSPPPHSARLRRRPGRARPGAFAVLATAVLSACSPKPPEGWSGYAEGEFVYVAPALAGTLTRLDAQRGQTVVAGAPLFALEATNEQAATQESAARLEAARAQAADTAKGRRKDEIEVIEAQLAQARTQARLAASELARRQGLVTQGFISPSTLDEARTTAAQTQARVLELEASLRVAHLPARADERAAASAQARAAVSVLAQSRWREAQTTVDAPASARVAETYFREGEWVGAGQPVVSLLPAAAVKARFFVPQAEIATLALGQPVQVSCDGCGAAIPATISFIATQAEYTPPVIFSNEQRAKLVFMVEAQPDAADAARLRPGLPLDVRRGAGAAP